MSGYCTLNVVTVTKDMELRHFKNVILTRLGADPVVVTTIKKLKNEKDITALETSILEAKEWSIQEKTDIQDLYISFERLNNAIWDAENRYGKNPIVRNLIDKTRHGSDVRTRPFEVKLLNALKGASK